MPAKGTGWWGGEWARGLGGRVTLSTDLRGQVSVDLGRPSETAASWGARLLNGTFGTFGACHHGHHGQQARCPFPRILKLSDKEC